MTSEAIFDSDMTFGPYPPGQCFHIEKSACYLGLGKGVKMVEFLLLRQKKRNPMVWVIEAKTKVPRETAAYVAYFDDVRVKMTNALMLVMAACLGRHHEAHSELPDDFKKLDLKTTDFRFVLVIKEVPMEHLVSLQNKLSSVLIPVVKTWDISANAVTVCNEKMAEKYGLILFATRAAR